MELSAILNGSDLCIGSTFVIANERIRVADIIVFGRLVTGFVTVARDDQIVVDIKTALLDCQPALQSNSLERAWRINDVATGS